MPNLKARLFWDMPYDEIDWQKGYRSIIERVLTWGNDKELEELISFYGREKVVHAITKEHVMIPNYIIDRVVSHFGLKKEDLYCYQWRLTHPYHWI